MVCEAVEMRFNDQIRPLLAEKCFGCHGPDTAARKADLRLDTRNGAVESGAVVPGAADQSELIARIMSGDPDHQMPPPDSHKQLSENDKQLLRQWIDAGAPWQKHWSFIPLRRPALPQTDGADQWARNPIDYFVLAKLVELGLAPNKPADRYTLARRAALDIMGLPPTDEQLTAFVDDPDSGAFRRYVTRLLQSPHAGEHRARYWLDAARYGDTHGMHVDNYREIWPYRDWVIQAFNQNMPFDQFIIEQIAGDLIPQASLDQKIATGFSRCNITTSEGGAIPEELDVRYMVDRVETTSTVLLGLTAGCAVCHDHKYDPLTQREFYQLGAFFNNTTQPAMDGNMKDTPPVVVLPRSEFEQEWKRLQEQRSRLRRQLRSWTTSAAEWFASRDTATDHPMADRELLLFLPFSDDDAGPALPADARWAEAHPGGRRGMRFAGKSNLTRDFPVLRSDQPLTISFWLRTPDVITDTNVLVQMGKTDDDKNVGWKISTTTSNDLIFELQDGHGKSIRGRLPDNEALRPGQWQHICVRYSGGQSNSSISILADGNAAALRNGGESLVKATTLADVPLQIAEDMPTAGMSDLRIFRRWISDNEVRLLAVDVQLRRLLAEDRAWSDLGDHDKDLLTNYHREVLDEDYRAFSNEYAATTRRRDFIYARSTTTLVMKERPQTPRAWVLERGDYTKRLDQVAAGVPEVLPPLPDEAPRNRMGLARWITAADHPLLARVTVNRFWQSIFGTGLVKTAEDFGVMGERPSHPELLDWLAVEFIESGWDVRHIITLMVTSAAYRQGSLVTPEKLAADPDDRFLSRGPRHRLDAELLRDQVLAVSGLLERRIGGRSVKPYQPDGLWSVVAITGSNTKSFKRDSGDSLYRRSLYTFWKRTSPPPSMAAFNAPTREQCTVRRERTNTPIQALVLLNDTQFVEAANFLAKRALVAGSDDQQRAEWMIWTVFRRSAEPWELQEITAAANTFRTHFRTVTDSAQRLLETGEKPFDKELDAIELASWSMVANTLLNRDDFVNK